MSQPNNNYLDQEIKSEDDETDNYGMGKLIKRININKSTLFKDLRDSVKPSQDSLFLNFEEDGAAIIGNVTDKVSR
jgi:hypothetical protein